MKKIVLAASLLVSVFSLSAFAAKQVSNEEVIHFKLVKLGTVTVADSGGQVSSPSDLHDKLSDLADKKGGDYYRIIAAREIGPNFDAVAEVYKDADKK